MPDNCALCLGTNITEIKVPIVDPELPNADLATHKCEDCGELMVRSQAGGLIYYLPTYEVSKVPATRDRCNCCGFYNCII